jgi:hypothetical protein
MPKAEKYANLADATGFYLAIALIAYPTQVGKNPYFTDKHCLLPGEIFGTTSCSFPRVYIGSKWFPGWIFN